MCGPSEAPPANIARAAPALLRFGGWSPSRCCLRGVPITVPSREATTAVFIESVRVSDGDSGVCDMWARAAGRMVWCYSFSYQCCQNVKRGLCLCTAGARPMPTHAAHRRHMSSKVYANTQREKTDVIPESTRLSKSASTSRCALVPSLAFNSRIQTEATLTR